LPEDVLETNYWISRIDKEELIDLLIYNSIQRNFSGKLIFGNPSFETMIKYYNESLHQGIRKNIQIPINTMELIYQNLLDKSGRHMMIFTEASSVVEEVLINQIREFEVSSQEETQKQIRVPMSSKGSRRHCRCSQVEASTLHQEWIHDSYEESSRGVRLHV
jgi:hypothetical protein